MLLKTLFVPRVKEGPLSIPDFYFMYNIWQDAGIRTRVAANAAKCATNELHTSLPKVPLFAVKYISHLKIIQFFVSFSEQNINNIDRPLHPGCSGIKQSNKYRLDRVLPWSYLLFLWSQDCRNRTCPPLGRSRQSSPPSPRPPSWCSPAQTQPPQYREIILLTCSS